MRFRVMIYPGSILPHAEDPNRFELGEIDAPSRDAVVAVLEDGNFVPGEYDYGIEEVK